MRQRTLAIAIVLVVALSPIAALAQIEGEWQVRFSNVNKNPPRDDASTRDERDTLQSEFVVEYRYDGGIPPKRFLVANGFSPFALPQTLYTTDPVMMNFELVLADIYEVCPSDFTLIDEDNRTIGIRNLREDGQPIGVATLTMKANINFRPTLSPGRPFHQLIVHDWGDLYEGLGDVSVLNFGGSLESMIHSAALMMRDRRCADAATPEECIDIVMASIRDMEPTEEEIDQGISGGQTFFPCAEASDN